MHPDLSSHLHTPECNRLIAALLQCHQDNKFKRFLGACNDANTVMLRCLKAEDIEDEYLNDGIAYETVTERSFNSLYHIEADGHYRLLVHSNKICLITLAPLHPIIKDNLEISSVDFQTKVLNNEVTGKKKTGAQHLTDCSILCRIHCEGRPQPFLVRSNLVSKLIEVNEAIISEPSLVRDCAKGYIAIVMPKLQNYERELGRWMTEDKYLKLLE